MMNISDKNLILKELDQVIIDLLIQQPFFGRLLAKMVKIIDPKYYGISINSFNQEAVQLKVNPEYWNHFLKDGNDKQTFEIRKNALRKQLLQFIFNHDLEIQGYEKKAIFIIAAELFANQYLEDRKMQNLLFENFPKIDFTTFKTLQNYYKIFRENFDEKQITSFLDLNSRHFEFLKNWKKVSSISEKGLEKYFRRQFILKSLPDNLVTDLNLPNPLAEYLNQLKNNDHSPINWKKMLRLFYNNSNRTKLSHTIRRKSKRYGTFPGIKIRKQSKLLVALDTSGSINNSELVLFFSEINHIWREKSEIKIVECDTHIRQNYNYEGIPPIEVKGRGNTDFNEPIQFANEKYKPDALIYFTDGFGPTPRIKSSKPILWVITDGGIKTHSKVWNNLPGRKVKMTEVT